VIVTIVVEMMIQRTTLDETVACRQDEYYNKCSQEKAVAPFATISSQFLWSLESLYYFLLRRVICAPFLDNAANVGYHRGGGGGPEPISFSIITRR
jgi:hypothetical protein